VEAAEAQLEATLSRLVESSSMNTMGGRGSSSLPLSPKSPLGRNSFRLIGEGLPARDVVIAMEDEVRMKGFAVAERNVEEEEEEDMADFLSLFLAATVGSQFQSKLPNSVGSSQRLVES
jgi:hypothetical protein